VVRARRALRAPPLERYESIRADIIHAASRLLTSSALAAFGLLLGGLFAGCDKGAPPAAVGEATAFAAVADSRLENAHVVTEKVISGAQPAGEPAFEALAELGVRTIISVDGARPDAELARRFGMRYVHLPITYSRVTHEQARLLAKAIDELEGPIYLHCHHGKHRSAAAVAVACVVNGSLPPERAEAVLATFGTGKNYEGLWESARTARPLDAPGMAALRSEKIDFPEAAAVPALAEAMVRVDFHTDNLKSTQQSGWRPPEHHPDLVPAHEALQLAEYLRELGRTEEMQARPSDFRRMMSESEHLALRLHELLLNGPQEQAAGATLKLLTASCTQCHQAYRD
jgi:protein tyrosine phosphatase (PTP) superfamily phosphohydrolase (DUF442 family)